jgi:hypothetical protein
MAVPPAKGLDEVCAWLHKSALTPFPPVTKLSRTTVTERTRLGRELNCAIRMLLESDLKESDFMCSIQIYDTYNIVQDLHFRVCDITLLGARGGV